MKKKFVIGSLIVMAIVLSIGIMLIFNSIGIGEKAGHVALQNQGGSIDSTVFERIITTTTTNFQITGAILAIIGGLGVLISGYGVYKEL